MDSIGASPLQNDNVTSITLAGSKADLAILSPWSLSFWSAAIETAIGSITVYKTNLPIQDSLTVSTQSF